MAAARPDFEFTKRDQVADVTSRSPIAAALSHDRPQRAGARIEAPWISLVPFILGVNHHAASETSGGWWLALKQ